MKSVMCAVVVFAGTVPAFADKKPDPPAVRALDLKWVRVVPESDFGEPKPFQIVNDEDLAVSPLFVDARSRAVIKSQVDFEHEKLVVFVWSGSGQDRLTGALGTDGKVAVFTYKVGLTDDLRRHAYAFAVPKDATVEVKKR
jgi:hypothetical protein